MKWIVLYIICLYIINKYITLYCMCSRMAPPCCQQPAAAALDRLSLRHVSELVWMLLEGLLLETELSKAQIMPGIRPQIKMS